MHRAHGTDCRACYADGVAELWEELPGGQARNVKYGHCITTYLSNKSIPGTYLAVDCSDPRAAKMAYNLSAEMMKL